MEPAPGDRFDIDWGHFGALDYAGTPRKFYAFCLGECHTPLRGQAFEQTACVQPARYKSAPFLDSTVIRKYRRAF